LITGNEADAADAVQEALLKAWQSLPKLRDADRFPAWFRRIVVRSALRFVEHRRRLVELDLEAPAPTNALDHEVELRRLERAFAGLDEKDRVVLALHHYWSLPVAETSRILGIPEGTVRSRVHHARQRLRAAFDSEQRS
jgi:RNA polymerase sigma-70 factor (ECF subfamily)